MDKRTILFIVALTLSFYLINNILFPPKPAPAPAPTQEQLQVVTPKPLVAPSDIKESLYVIENAYQQLVISNLGGAIKEINLSLRSKENTASVIRPIEFDKELQEDYPNQDRFPSGPYRTAAGSFNQGKVGGYYPLLRRSAPPALYGLSSSIEKSDEPPLRYTLKSLEKNRIVLEGATEKCRIVKTITLPEDPSKAPYCFDVDLDVSGDCQNLSLSTGIPEVEIVSGSSSPVLKYRLTRGNKPVVEKADLPKTSTSMTAIQPDWICNSNGFFGIILDPKADIGRGFTAVQVPGTVAPTRLSVIDAQHNLYPATNYPGYDMRIPLTVGSKALSFRVFAGPFDTQILKTVDANYKDPKTGYTPDFLACQSFHGWFSFISEPFAKFLFFLMEIFHWITRSWGLSIILLTAALRLMMYPLNAWSIKSTAKMQKLTPLITSVQERLKKDPKKMQMEMMRIYRENKINPLGGCFPLLIQMPFLIGMFDLLKSAFELRGVSFIPGWITNLTAPDVVFSWGYPIWFFGTSFHLLPFLLGASMYWQQKMSSNIPKDPKLLTDQQKQQKMMGNFMVIVFTVLFYHFPSGLNIYWLSSILLGILQQWWMTKRKPTGPEIEILPKKK